MYVWLIILVGESAYKEGFLWDKWVLHKRSMAHLGAEIDSATRLDDLDLRTPLLLDMLHAIHHRHRHRPRRVHGGHHARVHRVEHAVHLLLLRHQPLSCRTRPGKYSKDGRFV